jgi:hypothetical protein
VAERGLDFRSFALEVDDRFRPGRAFNVGWTVAIIAP